MKRPAIQLYVSDWQSNQKLRRCTHAEKGIWLDVMCLLHDSDEYGILRWPLKDIAQAVGCKIADLLILHTKGVLKGCERNQKCKPYIYTPRHAGKDGEPVILLPEQSGPIWYSSRMVRDEYVRNKRGMGTRFGDEPKDTPKPPIGDGIGTGNGDGPSSSSSTFGNKEEKEKVKKEKFIFPDWVPMADWEEYVKMRIKIRKPMTDRAMELAVMELEKLRDGGHDPAAVLRQSVFKSHQGLFPIHVTGGTNGNTRTKQGFAAAGKALAAEYRANAEREAQGAVGGDFEPGMRPAEDLREERGGIADIG